MEFVGSLVLMLMLTTTFAHISKRLDVPIVIGQLLVGIVVGVGGLNLIHPNEFIDLFAELGVILLMFLAGMESDFSLLKKYIRPAFFVAAFGIILPLFFGFEFSRFYQMPNSEALFIGFVFAATSVSISVEVLKELNVFQSKEGSTILGAAVIDDILVVLLFGFFVSFISGDSSGSLSLPLSIGLQLLYFVLIFALMRWIAPILMKLSTRLYVPAATIIMAVVICLGMAYLAELVGLSGVIGSFFAGIAISQTEFVKETEKNISVFGYSLFIPVFFVSIGLEVELSELIHNFGFILIFSIMAIVTKLFGGYFGGRLAKFGHASSFMVGSGMVSRGEMALIILQIGKQAGVIDAKYYGSLIVVIIISTLLSPFILKYFTKKVYPTAS